MGHDHPPAMFEKTSVPAVSTTETQAPCHRITFRQTRGCIELSRKLVFRREVVCTAFSCALRSELRSCLHACGHWANSVTSTMVEGVSGFTSRVTGGSRTGAKIPFSSETGIETFEPAGSRWESGASPSL